MLGHNPDNSFLFRTPNLFIYFIFFVRPVFSARASQIICVCVISTVEGGNFIFSLVFVVYDLAI